VRAWVMSGSNEQVRAGKLRLGPLLLQTASDRAAARRDRVGSLAVANPVDGAVEIVGHHQ